MPLSRMQLDAALHFLHQNSILLSELIQGLLAERRYSDSVFIADLASQWQDLLSASLQHSKLSSTTLQWTLNTACTRYQSSLSALARKDNGWHFSALRAQADQLREFRMEAMARDMETLSPDLWCLLDFMLMPKAGLELSGEDGQESDGCDSEDEHWAAFREAHDAAPAAKTGSHQKRRIYEKMKMIRNKKVVILSILMQSMNQQCNMLQAAFGMFLHSCNTPEKVVKSVSRMGISISLSSIHNSIKSLSNESRNALRKFGQSLLVAYTYDNFDTDLKPSVPTVEKSNDTLLHLTSGDLMRLRHVTIDDLNCSDQLWESSTFNRHSKVQHEPKTIYDVQGIHAESGLDSAGLSRRGRFNAWKFRKDLFQHGPAYFRQFILTHQEPESVDKIPLTKLEHMPARAMDINESTVSGNIDAISALLAQGGVGGDLDIFERDEDDPMEDSDSDSDALRDIGNHVVLIHGDLSTYERVRSAMDRRSLEATPYRRLQFVVFVMGLFHLKMACADAIWRVFIHQKEGRMDKNSLFAFASVMRPHETGKLASKPEFRQMHEIIMHAGIVFRLDAWRAEIQKQLPGCTSLEDFAARNPSMEDIEKISAVLAKEHVLGDGVDLFGMRQALLAERDQQYENGLLLHQYLLLYEELTYSMNMGDIGRLETLFPPWICLFKTTGKHKYANSMMEFITNLWFVFPEGLRRAIRYNILVNPTGKEGKFRGADWVVELLNLFTKVIYGGSGSNQTKERILTESPNIAVYRDSHTNFEDNFSLPGLTTRHADPDLKNTFDKLKVYMEDKQPNEIQCGRKSAYIVPNMISKGQRMLEEQLLKAGGRAVGDPGAVEENSDGDGIDSFSALEDLEDSVITELDLQV